MISDKMKIKIREVKPKELKKVAELKIKLDKNERKFDRVIKIWPKDDIVTYFKNSVLGEHKGKIFVAIDEETNNVIGYCNGWIYKADWLQYKDIKLGYVCDCFVLEKYRKMGIARKLIDRMLKWFKSKKIRISYLEVYLENENSHKVWKNLGFKDLEITMRRMVQ